MVTKQKILIVDDDNNIAELISLYLTKECFETRIVNDGEQALKDFASFQPDLILLDLMLPGIDGYQVCREIRHTSDVPIIMLSAKGETFDKVLGLELGADDYIIKPFDTKELVARVRAVLRRFKVRQPAGNPDENVSAFRSEQQSDKLLCHNIWENKLICRQKNWSFSIFWPHLQTRYLPANNYWIIYGDMNISVTLVP